MDQFTTKKLTPRVRQVLRAADAEADRYSHDFIGTEHVLLGLLSEPDGIAARVLRECGVDDVVRRRVAEIIQSPAYNRGSGGGRPPT